MSAKVPTKPPDGPKPEPPPAPPVRLIPKAERELESLTEFEILSREIDELENLTRYYEKKAKDVGELVPGAVEDSIGKALLFAITKGQLDARADAARLNAKLNLLIMAILKLDN